ncbi:MAG: antibiotic biosynthesis monooxygenase [Chloroflexota bacterium]
MSDQVYWMLETKINDGQMDNLKALMAEMVEATQANEPGTLNYEWSITADGQSCHIFERYADSEATLIHLGTFGKVYAARFMSILQPTSMMVYGNPNEATREALKGVGGVFMTAIGGFSR